LSVAVGVGVDFEFRCADKSKGNNNNNNSKVNGGGQECPPYSWPVKAWCSSDFFNASNATELGTGGGCGKWPVAPLGSRKISRQAVPRGWQLYEPALWLRGCG
jgi:hypothetical protein